MARDCGAYRMLRALPSGAGRQQSGFPAGCFEPRDYSGQDLHAAADQRDQFQRAFRFEVVVVGQAVAQRAQFQPCGGVGEDVTRTAQAATSAKLR